jgi:hypothetical protein
MIVVIAFLLVVSSVYLFLEITLVSELSFCFGCQTLAHQFLRL